MSLGKTHVAPSWRVNPHNGDHYSAYNKPLAVIDWLTHSPPEEEWLVILDADMILRAPFVCDSVGLDGDTSATEQPPAFRMPCKRKAPIAAFFGCAPKSRCVASAVCVDSRAAMPLAEVRTAFPNTHARAHAFPSTVQRMSPRLAVRHSRSPHRSARRLHRSRARALRRYLKGSHNELAAKHLPDVTPRADTDGGQPKGRRADMVGGIFIVHKDDMKEYMHDWVKFTEDVRFDPDVRACLLPYYLAAQCLGRSI
jgi:hypothetical protein